MEDCSTRDTFRDFFHLEVNDPELANNPRFHKNKVKKISNGDVRNEREDEKAKVDKIRERLNPRDEIERTDALTKKPINFHKEERSRKKETNLWLERHFGGCEWLPIIRATGRPIDDIELEMPLCSDKTRNPHRVCKRSIRRAQSMNTVPTGIRQQGRKEQEIIQPSTPTNKVLEKVIGFSATKDPQPLPHIKDKKKCSIDSIYRSTLSLNSVEKRERQKQESKLLRRSTISLNHPTPKMSKVLLPSENNHLRLISTVNKDNPSNDDVARQTSSLVKTAPSNHNHLLYNKNRQLEQPDSNYVQRETHWMKKSNFLGGNHLGKALPDSSVLNNFNSRNNLIQDGKAKVRRRYSTTERSPSLKTGCVVRPHLHQPLYITELRQNHLYPTLRQTSYPRSINGQGPDPFESYHSRDEFKNDLDQFQDWNSQTAYSEKAKKPSGSAGESSSFSSSTASNHQPFNELSTLPRLSERPKHSDLSSDNFSNSMDVKREVEPRSRPEPSLGNRLNYSHSSASVVRSINVNRNMYEFEKRVMMHSTSLEAQKFKTIIFLTGQ